jgi:hypothetical protein
MTARINISIVAALFVSLFNLRRQPPPATRSTR